MTIKILILLVIGLAVLISVFGIGLVVRHFKVLEKIDAIDSQDNGANIMQTICKDNDGFEDQLSPDRIYKVIDAKNNSLLIENDKSEERWYGKIHFTMPK